MLSLRLWTAFAFGIPMIGAVWLLPTAGFALLFGVIGLLALWEWTRMVGWEKRRLRGLLLGVNLIALAMLISRPDSATLYTVAQLGVAWWLLGLIWLGHASFGRVPSRRNRLIKTLAGSLIVVPAWAAAVLLHRAEDGPLWVLAAFGLIWSADSAAYFVGRTWGQHKLAPDISPGKTWEGLWGALVGSIGFAALASLLLLETGIERFALIGLAVVTVLFSVAGDLFESLIKRQADTKDSGTLFPGHGGAFDRFDSLFAALPIFALGKAWIGL